MTDPPGYEFIAVRACGHEETVTLYGNHTRRNEQRRVARTKVCQACGAMAVVTSPVLARLIEEVRTEDPTNPHHYDRMHQRHNRS